MKVEITAAIEDIKGYTGITDMGDPDYQLKLKVQITPGEYARLLNLQRQRVPMKLVISSDQAIMDLGIQPFGLKTDLEQVDVKTGEITSKQRAGVESSGR